MKYERIEMIRNVLIICKIYVKFVSENSLIYIVKWILLFDVLLICGYDFILYMVII